MLSLRSKNEGREGWGRKIYFLNYVFFTIGLFLSGQYINLIKSLKIEKI